MLLYYARSNASLSSTLRLTKSINGMNQLFSGQTRTRPSINLSGAGHLDEASTSASSSSSTIRHTTISVAERARLEREKREAARRLDSSARRIQSFWRGSHAAGLVRDEIRSQLDAVLAALDGEGSNEGSVANMLEATSRLAFIYRPGNKGDLARLSRWARLAATGKPRVRLFQPFQSSSDPSSPRYKHALIVLSARMIHLAAKYPR